MKKNMTLLLAVLFLVAGGGLGYYFGARQSMSPESEMTENQPSTSAPAAMDQNNGEGATAMTHPDWKTSTENGYSFQYPETIGTEFITTNDWPPKVQVTAGAFTCTPSGQDAPGGKTEQREINGTTYCVTTASEGAAGSVYSTYTYAFQNGDNVVSLSFTLRMVQCGNYDEPKMTACQNAQQSFSVDATADQMAQTISMVK